MNLHRDGRASYLLLSDTTWVAIRQRVQQNAVDDAEDRGVRSDAEREREHGHDGKAGILAQHSCAISNVLPQRFQHRKASLISVSFLYGLNSSQFDHRLLARLFRRHAHAKIVFDVQLKMALDLLIKFPVLALLVEQAANSHHRFTKSFHDCLFSLSNRGDMGKP